MPYACSLPRILRCGRFLRAAWSPRIRDVNSPSARHARYVSTAASNVGNADFSRQLEEMKSRHLPVPEGLWDQSNVLALRKSLQSHLSLPDLHYQNLVPPGYHQVSFNGLPYENQLSEDGAEQLHAPNEEWKFRVWAGGQMEFQRPYLWSQNPSWGPLNVAVREQIAETRLIGKCEDENAKAMVTLKKTLFQPKLDQGKPLRYDSGLLVPVRSNAMLVKEEKTLCFMRTIPPSLSAASSERRIAIPLDPTYSQTMTPSPTLLFRFSALTRNAHAIHLDAEYTRQVYGLSKPLVHGPLTSVLMLDVLGEALALHSIGQPHVFAIRTFQYRNLLPLFVGEQITIACKKMHDIEPKDTRYNTASGARWEKWDVWIQKGAGKDATLAVRGSARVMPVTPPDMNDEQVDFPDDAAI